MGDETVRQIEVGLDAEHSAKLRAISVRTSVPQTTIAESLLATALDQAELDADVMTALLDAIPGAWERAQQGLADARAGRVIPPDQL